MAAITLNIELTDAQRAIMAGFAPDGTAAEKKVWAEGVAKQALRREIMARRRQQVRVDDLARRESEAAAAEADRVAAEDVVQSDWPET